MKLQIMDNQMDTKLKNRREPEIYMFNEAIGS